MTVLPWLTSLAIFIAFLLGIVRGLEPMRLARRRAKALLKALKGDKEEIHKHMSPEGSEAMQAFMTKKPGNTFAVRERIDDFTVEDFWIDASGGERFWMEQGPSAFVASGIFFTFLGIMIGLSDLELNTDTSALQNSLGTLVNGLSTAFVSSLAGVACSVVFTAFRSQYHSSAQVEAHKLRSKLIEDGRLLVPESLLWSMFDEVQRARAVAEESNNALKNLVDIANGVDGKVGQLATDIAEKVTTRLGDRMTGIVQEQLVTSLDSIQRSFDNFATGQVASQSDTLAAVVQSFVEQLQSELHGHFEELAVALRETRSWYEQTHAIYRETGENLGIHVALQRDQLDEERAFFSGMRGDLRTLAEQREKLAEVEAGLLTRLTDTLQHARAVEESAHDVLSSLEATAIHIQSSSQLHHDTQRSLLSQTDQIVQQMTDHTKQVSIISGEFRGHIDQLGRELVAQMTAHTTQVSTISGELRGHIDQLRQDLGEGLTTTFSSFDEGTAQVVNHLNGSFMLLNQSSAGLDATLGSLDKSLTRLQGVLGELPQAVATSILRSIRSAQQKTES